MYTCMSDQIFSNWVCKYLNGCYASHIFLSKSHSYLVVWQVFLAFTGRSYTSFSTQVNLNISCLVLDGRLIFTPFQECDSLSLRTYHIHKHFPDKSLPITGTSGKDNITSSTGFVTCNLLPQIQFTIHFACSGQYHNALWVNIYITCK